MVNELIDLSTDYIPLEVDLHEEIKNQPGVLSKFKGQFFCPNGKSRNGRFYTESLWQKVLESNSTKEKLESGMLGTLLHPKDDKLAHPMYASHVNKNLWIDDNKRGMGEAYILDTPVGRIVETFNKSKLVKLFVSSRAWGKLSKNKVKGLPAVDEDTFQFKTFDVVLEPGFLEAAPQFEALHEDLDVKNMVEDLAEMYLDNGSDFYPHLMSKKEYGQRARSLVEDINKVF